MIARLAAVLGAMLMVSGCMASGSALPQSFTPGTTVHVMNVAGLDRSYRVHVPATLPSPAPLVVMLHGGFGSADQAERAYGWDQLADAAGFVVAYPDGVGRAWNVHGCCGRPSREDIDDVGFVAAVVDDIGANIAIDRARLYATGISNGGMMAYTLACTTGMFAAIGPDSATQLDACTSPHPTSVLHIHGADDRLIRYDGAPGVGVARIDGPSVPELNTFWRNVDRCGEPDITVTGSVTTSNAQCPDGRNVVLMTVERRRPRMAVLRHGRAVGLLRRALAHRVSVGGR